MRYRTQIRHIWVLLLLLGLYRQGQGYTCPNTLSTPTLTVDRTNYLVGETPTYILCGAPPHSNIRWSSWKDGSSTGEVNMAYEPADAQGEWIKLGNPWSTAHTGFWTKEVLLDNRVRLRVHFNVSESLPTSSQDYKSRIGITHWASKPRDNIYDESYLLVGAKRVQNVGAEHLFVSLGPDAVHYDPDYFREHPVTSLTELVQSDPFKKLFALPFKTFLLTTYSFTNRTWTGSKPRPPFSSEMARREKEEFQQLTQYLIRTYQGSGKTFILKNWEGDWGLVDSGGDDPISIPTPYQIENHIAYQRARRQGVVEGRGSSRMVLDALEFWRVQRPQQNIPSYLRDVIPYVESDFISLSAWEVIPPPTSDLRRRIIDDITFIQKYPGVGNRPLIVAEYGFDAYPDNADRSKIATQAFLDGGAFQAYYWLLESNGTGLLGLDGRRTDTWHHFRTLLEATNDSQVISTRMVVAAVPHQTSTFSIQLKNKGTIPWNSANGYRLIPLNEQHAAAWGLGSIPLSGPAESIEPGDIKTFTIQATTPENPERYPLEWQMQQEHVGAFGERIQNLGETPLAPPEKPRVFPNPWRKDQHTGPITFDRLPSGSTVELYTLSGRWIKTLYETNHQVIWDLTNDSHNPVASGYYFYLIHSETSGDTRGTLAVIR